MHRSVLSRAGLFGNPAVLISIAVCALLQAAFVYAAPMQAVFQSTALDTNEWLRVFIAGGLLFICAEAEKLAIGRLRRRPAEPVAA